MTIKQVLAAMNKGAILCMGYGPEGKEYWLEPKRLIISPDVARVVISFPGIVPGGDKLFKDDYSQTWRANG